jgi:hypothetical protein
MKRLLVLLMITVLVLLPGFVRAAEGNPNATITWPPPVYVVRGKFQIRGTANLPNMTNYFIECHPLNGDLSLQGDVWFPAILPSQAAVQDGVLGVWDTTLIADGIYQVRLTVNVSQGNPVLFIVSPLRVQNTPSPFEATPMPSPTPLPPLPSPTLVPAQDTTPRATIDVAGGQSANVREGDSTFYKVVAYVPTGATARILGISNRGTGWYQIQLDNGLVGWIAPSVVSTSGDLTNLPRVQPPPPPLPTAIPATPVPVSQANLVAGIVEFNPGQPTCAQTFTVGFDVANLGTQPTTLSGTISLVDVRSADGTQQGSTIGGFPVLQPGQTFRVNMPLTISTWYNEQHNIRLVIDPANQIPESNEGDNVRVVSYTLQKGSCP